RAEPRSYSTIAPSPESAPSIAALITSNEVPIPPSSVPPAGAIVTDGAIWRASSAVPCATGPLCETRISPTVMVSVSSSSALRQRPKQVSRTAGSRIHVTDGSLTEIGRTTLARPQRFGGRRPGLGGVRGRGQHRGHVPAGIGRGLGRVHGRGERIDHRLVVGFRLAAGHHPVPGGREQGRDRRAVQLRRVPGGRRGP